MRYYSAVAAAVVAVLASYLWASLVSDRDGASNGVGFGGKEGRMASNEQGDRHHGVEDSGDQDSSDDDEDEDDDFYEDVEDEDDENSSPDDVGPILEAAPAPDVNWHLQGDAPFVIVDDILPKPLLDKILIEIEKGTKHVPGESADCVLERDGSDCGDERWFAYSLEEKGQPRDIFEQAVEFIVKADLERVLPHSVAAAVKGSSWRILLTESGDPSSVFHYDSDEDTDYAIPGTPLIIHPLLATVTYLTDYGNPTTVFDHAITSREKLYAPKAAYVCMPRANKHIGFDARLFHGSGAPIPKGKGKLRIIIGMNYHTRQSLETIVENVTLNENGLVKPIDVSKNGAMKVTPWNNDQNIITEEEIRDTWESFELETSAHGLDLCGVKHAPCRLFARLPVEEILHNETDKPGSTIGIQLGQGDFVIRQVPGKKKLSKFPPSDDKATALALKMLRERCAIYEKGVYTMNPPLNNIC